MKKLLIRFAFWILRKHHIERVCVDLGCLIRYRGCLYAVEMIEQTIGLGGPGILKIRAKEILLKGVSDE